MFTAPAKTNLPNSYLERRRRLQNRSRASSAVESGSDSNVAPRMVKSVERCLTSLVNALPQDNLVIEDLVIRGDLVEVRYRAELPSAERVSGLLEDDAVEVARVEILRLDNGAILENWDTVYQVKTAPEA
jgi:predicted SnoaL-like aldol condensation-catalyzing enzyme